MDKISFADFEGKNSIHACQETKFEVMTISQHNNYLQNNGIEKLIGEGILQDESGKTEKHTKLETV